MVHALYHTIKQLRLKNGHSQAYLASELGISRPTYMQIENGARELTVSEAKKLAGIFNMSLEDFLNGKESKHKVTIEKESAKKSNDLEIRITEKNLKKFKQVL